MTDWLEMTDAEREARNDESWAACADLLRRAARDNPDLDLNALKALVEARMVADMRENDYWIKRGARKRATKSDKRSAEFSRAENARLGFDVGMLWDVEID